MSDYLSTDPYKGVRDFYPEDQFIQRYIYALMQSTAEEFGYLSYDASILEPAELYEAKTGEEIVSEQTYTFEDRGGRRVTLRPEMTPTVARMVAKKRKELSFPIRWYSLPNLFRYERPQKGRLREHVQLNVDLFGSSGVEADAEIIEIASSLLSNAGAKTDDFVIHISSREVVTGIFELFDIDESIKQPLSKLIDKKTKMEAAEFSEKVRELIGEKTDEFIQTIESPETVIEKLGRDHLGVQTIHKLLEMLAKRDISNVEFQPTLMRGFDYYTGMIFEVFDTNPENNRSLFGGGRYDELLAEFGVEPVPAVGFGMGDVTMREFLESRDLLPAFRPSADLYLCRLDEQYAPETNELARKLRQAGLNVEVDITNRKVGDQVKTAHTRGIPYIICVGKQEVSSKRYTLKELESGEETTVGEDEIVNTVFGKE